MNSAKTLQQSFTLPCGVTIPNRIVKSAMSENNADNGGKPSERILQLYKTWGEGGTGILISGMYLEGASMVVASFFLLPNILFKKFNPMVLLYLR